MEPEHLVIWHIDRAKIEMHQRRNKDSAWSVEALAESVKQDFRYYRCRRIHAVNGYGCAFLEGNLSNIMMDLMKYRPYLRFKFLPAQDPDRVGLIFERMKEGLPVPDMHAILGTSIEGFQETNDIT